MFGIPWIEFVGYAASILIAISIVMTDMYKLRVINTAGCLLFFIYGIIIKAYPVGLVNLFMCFVNLYYLMKMKR